MLQSVFVPPGGIKTQLMNTSTHNEAGTSGIGSVQIWTRVFSERNWQNNCAQRALSQDEVLFSVKQSPGRKQI